jgi:hypothetical protein
VLASLANGSLCDELAAHLSSCAICQDAKLVWSYLQDSVRAEAQTDIPPAGIVWWKAQLARKRIDARRSVALIETMHKIALAALVVLLVAIGASQVPKLLDASPMILAGSAAVLLLFLVSVIVMLGFARESNTRALPRRM